MSDFKYIMIQNDDYQFPVIFPDKLNHIDMAKYITYMLKREHGWDAKVVSAGTIQLEGAHCFGNSETLKLASNPDDSRIIDSYPYSHGYVGK